ncbi:MAG: PP2C family serine/threonine-protein phosphatase [Methanomicrobiales archaeon]|nr:PP2C family serine/threonine-protein phosphatase [Methanomicrobiales archaeon]
MSKPSVKGTKPRPFIVGTSVIGQSHRSKGLPCQDHCAYLTALNFPRAKSRAVIALADGLGSADRSLEGASCAVLSALEEVRTSFLTTTRAVPDPRPLIIRAAHQARKCLDDEASRARLSLRAYACTLILVLISGPSVAIGHIGDGGVVILQHEDYILASAPHRGEYVNEVVPLTSDCWEESFRMTPWMGSTFAVAAFTDGCQGAVLTRQGPDHVPYVPFFSPLFQYIADSSSHDAVVGDITRLLSSPRMGMVSPDDKTLAVAIL